MGPFRLAALRCTGRDPRHFADEASGAFSGDAESGLPKKMLVLIILRAF
jgi:hypothetical protein